MIGSGNLRIPLVYIEDVVDAILLGAERDVLSGSIFNLIDPEIMDQNEYLAWCQSVSEKPIRIVRASRFLLNCAGFAAEKVFGLLHRDAPLSRYRLNSARPIGPCNCEAARVKLGWTPRVGVKAGLARGAQPQRISEPAPIPVA